MYNQPTPKKLVLAVMAAWVLLVLALYAAEGRPRPPGADVSQAVETRTLEERVEALETSVARMQTPTPTALPTSTSTSTRTQTPTATQTATPVPTLTVGPVSPYLCSRCAVVNGCPDGLVCRNCYQPRGYRCVRPDFPNSDCQLCDADVVPSPTAMISPTPTQTVPPTGTIVPTVGAPTRTATPHPATTPDAGAQDSAWRGYVYIPYDFSNTNWSKLHPEWGKVGSMVYFRWLEVNPSDGAYNWKPIDDYLNTAWQQRKPATIEIILWDAIEKASVIGENYTPGWVGAKCGKMQSCRSGSGPGCKTMCYPAWSDQCWKEQYFRFVAEFGKRYDDPVRWPALGAVTIATGFDREAVEVKSFADCDYGGSTNAFYQFINDTVVAYAKAFQEIPAFLQDMLHGTPINCALMESLGGSIGEKLNGLEIDAAGSRITFDGELVGGLTGFSEVYWNRIPTGFEPKHGCEPSYCYWMLMEGLSVHPTFMDLQEDVVQHSAEVNATFPLLGFVQAHLGTSAQTAPSAWIVLRETKIRSSDCWTGSDGVRRCYDPYSGNYEFFLHENRSVLGAKSIATAPLGEGLPAPAKSHMYARERGRRTDFASGNPLMAFSVDSAWLAAHPGTWRVRVTLLDSPGQFAFRAGTLKTVIKKGGSNAWKDYIFEVSSEADLVIDALADGDEFVHRIIVEPAG